MITLLMFAAGVPLPFIIIWWAIVAASPNKESKPPTININVPSQSPPVQRWRGVLPGNDSSTWAQYALRNPEVKLQMVEKLEIANGQFTAEKHMRMTGPLPEQSIPHIYPNLKNKGYMAP